jgi:hypothetical protein
LASPDCRGSVAQAKPRGNDKLLIEIDRMIAQRRLEYENTHLKQALKQRHSSPNIISKSDRMVKLPDVVSGCDSECGDGPGSPSPWPLVQIMTCGTSSWNQVSIRHDDGLSLLLREPLDLREGLLAPNGDWNC